MSLPVPARSSYDLQHQKNQARLYLKEFQGVGVVEVAEAEAEAGDRKEKNQMTHRLGRVKKQWVGAHGTMGVDGLSLNATDHLTEPRSYAGTPAAVPAQIYTDEDCSNMPTPGPRNFEGRTYAGVFRDEDCDDTPKSGPRNFGKRTYSGKGRRRRGRKSGARRGARRRGLRRRAGTKARDYSCPVGMKKDPDYPGSGTPCILDTAGVR